MSKLRPECSNSTSPSIGKGPSALERIRNAVARRRSLAHGMLTDGDKHCAMGCFWDDEPLLSVPTDLIDRIAAINDAHPTVSPFERWKRVMAWFNHELGI